MIASLKTRHILRICLLFAAIAAQVTAFTQPYNIENISLKLRDPSRGNRRIPVEIFYPVTKYSSDSVMDDKTGKKFPLICFGHGFVLDIENYRILLDSIVSKGFIIAFPMTEKGFFPSHRSLAADLRFVLDKSPDMGSDQSSPLYGIVDSARCLIGHSMGGGAAFHAAARNTSLTSLAAITPYNTKPSAAEAAGNVSVPTLIISGAEDCITPADKHQLNIYNGSGSAKKTLITILGGTHCPLGIEKSRCTRGEKISGCLPVVSHSKQLGTLLRHLMPWLEYTLKGNETAAENFNAGLDADDEITFIRSNPL
jgi:predicted dienelactone hydrolase